MQKFIVKIERENFALIQDADVECYILSSTLPETFVKEFAKEASRKDKIVLLDGENAPLLCKKLDLDGVVVDVSRSEKIKNELKTVRGIIGKHKFLGVVCRNRRHEAMIASEEEPDFVAFKAWKDGIENIRELTAWYNELFLIQSAVYCMDENMDFKDFECDIVILNEKDYTILVAKNKSLD